MRGLIAGLCALTAVSCGGKKPTEDVVIEGWHKGEGWSGECYHPKNYEAMGPGDRKIYRATVLDEMMSQWSGKRGDGAGFDAKVVEDVETALFGKPEFVESVSVQNLAKCRDFMMGKNQSAWGQWFNGVADTVNEGECPHAPLNYQLFDYLDIGRSWQIPAGVCRDDEIKVSASLNDYYRITEDGPWINAEGVPGSTSAGADVPCTEPDCTLGMVVMKFVGLETGLEIIKAVGGETTFRAPEHGRISITINDGEFYDNTFKVEGGMEHHTQIEYGPAQ